MAENPGCAGELPATEQMVSLTAFQAAQSSQRRCIPLNVDEIQIMLQFLRVFSFGVVFFFFLASWVFIAARVATNGG